MTILESTSIFIKNNLGGSYVLRDIYTYVLPKDQNEAERRLDYAVNFIGSWRKEHDKINELISANKLKQAEDLLSNYSFLCEQVGSSSDTNLRMEIDNRKWNT